LRCPESGLTVEESVIRRKIGVSGCGHRALYIKTREGWVLTYTDQEGTAASPEATSPTNDVGQSPGTSTNTDDVQ
jgi:hypothetical protein